ncbi:Uncharacterised protein [Legionella busanensis]|uniref:Uncharacterized protein n=1 Tax=Legionella busanensis TaxID=190655 RepID=A0A378JK32_9GAMM|nr:hypothetical protein [Legionella busanensis]STX51048.1 Uncharacterised protein [Legionella busanensis]
METRQETSKHPMPKAVEMAVRKQIKFVVDYLEEIARLNGQNFILSFQGKSDIKGINSKGRLFSDARLYTPPVQQNVIESTTQQITEEKTKKESPPLSAEQIMQEGMERFFADPKLVNYALQRLSMTEIVMDENTKIFAKSFIEDFFKLIEQSPEWQIFYQNRKKEFSSPELEPLLGQLVDKIKGAFAYKLMSVALRENRDVDNVKKEIVLQEFFINYPDLNVPLQGVYKNLNEGVLTNQIKWIQEHLEPIVKADTAKDTSTKATAQETLAKIVKNLLEEEFSKAILNNRKYLILGSKERAHFILNYVGPMLWDVRVALRTGLTPEKMDLLKEYENMLADFTFKLFSEHNSHDELNDLSCHKDSKNSIVLLANFILPRIKENYHNYVSPHTPFNSYEKKFFDEKSYLSKVEPKHRLHLPIKDTMDFLQRMVLESKEETKDKHKVAIEKAEAEAEKKRKEEVERSTFFKTSDREEDPKIKEDISAPPPGLGGTG